MFALVFSVMVAVMGTLLYLKGCLRWPWEEQPTLVWWTGLGPGAGPERQVEGAPGCVCRVSSDRALALAGARSPAALALLFYGSRIRDDDFPAPAPRLPWALFHEESPKNYAPFLHAPLWAFFNLTATFSRRSHFPLTLQYLNDVAALTDDRYVVTVKDKNKMLDSIAPVLYVQSDCDTPSGRDFLVSQLMKYIKVDSYGKCLNNKKFPQGLDNVYPLDLYNEAYLKFVAKYKFVISIENAICEDYISEKLWRPLMVGSVPIYLGSPSIEDYLPNKRSAILMKNFSSVESLAAHIHLVNENDTLYESYLEHKREKRVSGEALRGGRTFGAGDALAEFERFACRWLCGLEEAQPQPQGSVYECERPSALHGNTWGQHWDVGRCQGAALVALLPSAPNYTPAQFHALWQDCLHQKHYLHNNNR